MIRQSTWQAGEGWSYDTQEHSQTWNRQHFHPLSSSSVHHLEESRQLFQPWSESKFLSRFCFIFTSIPSVRNFRLKAGTGLAVVYCWFHAGLGKVKLKVNGVKA